MVLYAWLTLLPMLILLTQLLSSILKSFRFQFQRFPRPQKRLERLYERFFTSTVQKTYNITRFTILLMLILLTRPLSMPYQVGLCSHYTMSLYWVIIPGHYTRALQTSKWLRLWVSRWRLLLIVPGALKLLDGERVCGKSVWVWLCQGRVCFVWCLALVFCRDLSWVPSCTTSTHISWAIVAVSNGLTRDGETS